MYRGNSWLGREDSNLRMRVPKTRVLPLDDAPLSDGPRETFDKGVPILIPGQGSSRQEADIPGPEGCMSLCQCSFFVKKTHQRRAAPGEAGFPGAPLEEPLLQALQVRLIPENHRFEVVLQPFP